ncbi:MAG: glycosyltransferase [Caldilineaceae bacterium]|nr:glycosyltransferase [Caldilineaceae bacterium]
MVVPYTPNPVRVRPYQFLRTLLRRGHDVTLATLWTDEQEQAELAVLSTLGATVLAEPMPIYRSLANSLVALAGRLPLQAAYSWSPALMARIRATLRAEVFDAVHVEHLRGSRYAMAIRYLLEDGELRGCPALVWDSVDCISFLFEQAARTSHSLKSRIMTRLELERTRRHEARMVGLFARTLVTSRLDKAALTRLAADYGTRQDQEADDQIEVIANGVDLQHFAFRPMEDRPADRIVFTGKMSYHANVTAARYLVNEIMPMVWARRPQVQVWLVGKDPTPAVRALASAANHTGPHGEPGVVVTGAVPSMNDYIQGATVAAAPLLYGAGIQNKVLEAMSCGTPVVATRQASAALDVVSGRDLLVADDAHEFAQAVLDLLENPARRREVGAAGRTYVEQKHSWEAIADRLETIYGVANPAAVAK